MDLVLGGLIFTACAPTQPTPMPTAINLSRVTDVPLPTDVPGDVPTDITQMRPYTEASIWNTPIGPAPRYDPHSAEMIATIGLDSGGHITANTDAYGVTLYFIDGSTPRWDIPCIRYRCTIVTPGGTTKTNMLTGIPIPFEANPASGTDASMIIIDKTTYAEYNLWGVERTATGWTVRNGSIYNMLWDAMPTEYGSRGAGIPYYAGLVRPWEIIQGRIDHAIAFAYPYPAEGRCVFPASKTDGNSSLPYAIPEGARLQLDPSLTEIDFNHMGLNRTGKIIARALQEYGMILINYGGRPKINIENLVDNPYATIQWSDPELNLTTQVIAAIPYSDFRVIALPESYSNPAPDSPLHGACYAYP
jgi:hypothetical protein